MPTLVKPASLYKRSFIDAIDQYKQEHWERYMSLDPVWLEDNFDTFIQQIENESRGENLPENYVAHTEYWLVDGERFLGRIDIRHSLTEWLRNVGGLIGYDIRADERGKGYGKLILKLGLEKAREMGFEKVLLTCDATNIRSKKVILSQGGILEGSTDMGEGKPKKERYWITL